MKIRRVSIDALKESAKPKALTPAQRRRVQLERDLEQAISAAKSDTSSAFKLILDPGEKFPTVRLAFNRVRERLHASEINLHKRGDDIYIAALAHTRGRRRKSS